MTTFAFDVGVAGHDLFVGDIMRYLLMLYCGLPLAVTLAIWAVTVAAIKLFDWMTSPRTPRPTSTEQTSPPPVTPPPLSQRLGLPKYPT